jgi:hypothetical protein
MRGRPYGRIIFWVIRVKVWQAFVIVLGVTALAIILIFTITTLYLNVVNQQALSSMYQMQ